MVNLLYTENMKLTNIKFQISNEFSTDHFVRWGILLSLLIEITTLILVFVSWQKLPPLVPLFYSLPWGEEQLTTPLTLLLFILSGLGISFLNIVLAYIIAPKSKFFSHIVLANNVIVTFLICFAALEILFMIT